MRDASYRADCGGFTLPRISVLLGVWLISVVPLWAQSQTAPAPPPPAPATNTEALKDYVIGQQDLLQITFLEAAELSREVRVNAIGGGSEEIMRDLAARQMGW